MTGFGASSAPLGAGRVVVEVRSVNARSLDVRMRLPEMFGDATLWAEQLVRGKLRRGRVEVSVVCDAEAAPMVSLDRQRALEAMRALTALGRELGDEARPPLAMLTAVPGLFSSTRGLPAAREAAQSALKEALDALDIDRAREGRAIAEELLERARTIMASVERARGRAACLPDAFRARLADRVARLAPSGVDVSRLEAEVALLAERCDVSEELSRLSTHVTHMMEIVARHRAGPSGGEPDGRRLDFLLQEALREATTLAVKSQDAGVSTDVVEMKVELERMREQVQNVE